MRRSGRTTRLIDDAVQTLFTQGEVTPMPHLDIPNEVWRKEQDRMVKILCRRVELEHGIKLHNQKNEGGWITVKIKS